MQIHELNGYTGALDDAYMAVDNGSDTGKKKIKDITDPLNARINNIIAGGDAPSEAEIIDARLGADGVTYPSLGDAIRDQFTDVKAEINQTNIEFVLSRNGKTGVTAWSRNPVFTGLSFKANNTYLITFKPNPVITASAYGYILQSDNTELANVALKDKSVEYIAYTPAADISNAKIALSASDTGQHPITVSIENILSDDDVEQVKNNFLLKQDEVEALKSLEVCYPSNAYVIGNIDSVTGIYNPLIRTRVCSKDIEIAPANLRVSAKTGYKFYVVYYSDGAYSSTSAFSTFIEIPKDSEYRLVIARYTETSTDADLYIFASSVVSTYKAMDQISDIQNTIGETALYKETSINYSGAWHRETLFNAITLEKNRSYLFKVKYATALTSTAYLYLVKSDNSDYKTYSIGVAGTTEFTVVITPTIELQNVLFKVASGQASFTANFELMPLHTMQSVIDMNYKHISRESLPKQTLAIGHAGAYSGAYSKNTIENAMYNVINHGFKAIECDVKMTSDYVPVISHEGTVEYEGQTYNINDITYAQATQFGLKPLEPFVQCSKRYGFRLFIDSPFSNGDYQNQCDALLELLHGYGSTANIMVVVNYALANALKYLVSKDTTIAVGLIYFNRNHIDGEVVAELQNLSNGEVSIWLELDNAITTDDADYINAWRSQGVSFGMFTIYNDAGYDPIVITKAWANLVDYIITEYNETPALLMEYDFPN